MVDIAGPAVVWSPWPAVLLRRQQGPRAPASPDYGAKLKVKEGLEVEVAQQIVEWDPSLRGRRLAVEHVLGMLAAGDSVDDLLSAYPGLERDDVLACLAYAHRVVGHERIEFPAHANS